MWLDALTPKILPTAPHSQSALGMKRALSRLLRHTSPRVWHTLKYQQYLQATGEREIHHLKGMVDPNKAAVDAGVYLGFYTRKFCELTESVYGFEPHDENYSWAVRSLPSRAHLHHVALSDQDGSTTLRVPLIGADKGESALSSCAESNDFGGAPCRSLTVAMRRLDSFDLPPVGFIKIDVEGYEEFVIRGAVDVLKRDRPNLMIEIEERHNPGGFVRIRRTLGNLGYEAHYLAGEGLTPFEACADVRRLQLGSGTYVNNFFFLPR